MIAPPVNLWVDDERPAPAGWIHDVNVEDALHDLICFTIYNLSLDNDLGVSGIENEGREVVRRLCAMQEEDGFDFWPRETLKVHSANPVARDAMYGMIERYAPFRYDRSQRLFLRSS